MIFTSLLLLLCQTDTAQPLEVDKQPGTIFSTYSVTFTEPTGADYRKAMHLIDVRGRYEEGAAKLIEMIDRPDVIEQPGQASWLLAQAARALTLAGKNEEAAKYIPGARNGSRGTPLEQIVSDLLLSFSPESVSLDGQFLDYVLSQANSSKPGEELISNYGRSLLPYFRFILGSQDAKYGLQTKQRIAKHIFPILDLASVDWLVELIASDSALSPLILSDLAKQNSTHHLSFFIDKEAFVAVTQVLLRIDQERMAQGNEPALFPLLAMLRMRVRDDGLSANDPALEELANALSALVEGMPSTNRQRVVQSIAGLSYEKYRDNNMLLISTLANSQDSDIREEIRWQLSRQKGAEGFIRQWALSGRYEDELRFCLPIHPIIVQQMLNGPRKNQVEEHEWTMSYLAKGSIGEPFHRVKSTRSELTEEDFAVLNSLISSSHPFIRYLASTTLLAKERVAEAAVFLEQLGDDPQWASFTLDCWIRWGDAEIPEESVDNLTALALESPVQENARALFETKGNEVLTIPIWSLCELNPSHPVGQAALYRALGQDSVQDLVWLMTYGNINPSKAADAVSERWPRTYIENIKEMEKVGRRFSFLSAERNAWQSLAKNGGAEVLRLFEEELEQFLVSDISSERDNQNFYLVFKLDSNLGFSIASRHLQDSKVMRRLFQTRNVFNNIVSEEVSTKFAIDVIIAGYGHLFMNDDDLLKKLIDPSLEIAQPFFDHAWASSPYGPQYSESTVAWTISSPDLRDKYKDVISKRLLNPEWTLDLCIVLLDHGVVPEMLDDLLLAIESKPSKGDLQTLLYVVGTVDNPRVVELLVSYLDDSRTEIAESAAASLSNLEESRKQKNHWAKWVDGEPGTHLSAMDALLSNLKDPDLEIRLVSIESLGTLGDKDALPALINLLRDEDPQIKAAARKALDRINKVPTSTQDQVKAQLTVLLSKQEGELAAMRLKFTDDHIDVAGMLKKIEITKQQLAELESD